MRIYYLFLILLFSITSYIRAQSWESTIWLPKEYKSERISSYDITGGNNDYITIGKGERKTIADIKGSGVIKHIWITLNSKDLMVRRNAVIRFYWDGNDKPAVEVPLGDFFGQGWGEEYNLISAPLVVAPKKGKAMNSYFPMPFESSAKIEIENEGDVEIANFYFYIDYY